MISGVVASIRWQYYEAAAINGYTISRDKETREWSVIGNIIAADAFKLSQSPLMLVVPFKGGKWQWPIRGKLPRTSGPFAVKLGQPLERSFYVHAYSQAGNRPY